MTEEEEQAGLLAERSVMRELSALFSAENAEIPPR